MRNIALGKGWQRKFPKKVPREPLSFGLALLTYGCWCPFALVTSLPYHHSGLPVCFCGEAMEKLTKENRPYTIYKYTSILSISLTIQFLYRAIYVTHISSNVPLPYILTLCLSTLSLLCMRLKTPYQTSPYFLVHSSESIHS